MKNLVALVAGAMLLTSTLAGADEVVEARQDRVVGGGFGGLSGFMLGAAAGPIGALIGGGLGYFVGQGAQQAAGLDQTLYIIEAEDGSQSQVRSSANGFVVGQQVERDGAKLTALNR
ncbi:MULTISPECIES: hypothetical protein [Pseudomonadaceae]|uniref:hypothetical protein n=1 Tax=Pseudomonadaceae TaxID=135621 RepID=UPI0015E3ED38|nr:MULTISPECIES: hypothetical protein [Pseudomonadaceae]MBA1280135.1 hypothetical protein [Stutzerimonas stutzeri]MBC8651307.1 hypothetical protein [Pseudomonas sp. MT4]QXY91835.1 hypothetical protein GYM54_09690 [Pseudomonas sp. MTM4]